jgi:hypothetical protein
MLVYLDTSFLSEFAKVEMGVSSHAEKWETLLSRLRQGVQLGNLICPASQFQTQEALLARNINIFEFTLSQLELSKGYFFRDWQDILVHQTANQVLIYLGRPQDIDLGWNILTTKLPPVIAPHFTMKSKRAVKEYAEVLQKRGSVKSSFAEEYEWQKVGVICETFLQPLRQLLGLDTYRKSPDPVIDLYTGYFGMLIREANISENELPKVLDFFEPESVDRIPYVHICASIYASLRFYEQARKPQSGDWLDVATLACAIPYCDIVTTDTNMKTHIVKRLHLDTKYGAHIFTPTAKDIDAFLERLSPSTQ